MANIKEQAAAVNMLPNARLTAAQVINSVFKDGAYANIALGKALSKQNHSEQDRRFVTELVYGTVKAKGTIDWLLQQLVALAESSAIRERVRRELQKQVEKRGREGLWSSLKLWAAKKLDVVNVEDATDAICRALVGTAHRLQDDEQWRSWLYAQLQRVAGSVYGTQAWRELVQSLQNCALHDISLQSALKQLLDNMIKALCRPLAQEGSAVARPTILLQAVQEALETIETDLRSDAQFKTKAEAYLQHILGLGLLQAQTMLGDIVERILQAMADERLTEMVRSKVNTDMQRIRLNGTVMGAFLGAIFYLLKCAW